jgi:hypothetical protein
MNREQSLEKIKRDYALILKNSFWIHFWANVEENRRNLLETLGGAANESESEVRVYQGMIRAFNALKELPDTLINILEGEPETAPQGEEYE